MLCFLGFRFGEVSSHCAFHWVPVGLCELCVRHGTRDTCRTATGETYFVLGYLKRIWLVVTVGRSKRGRKRKKLCRRAPDNHTRPLHVVTPWPVPWLNWRSAELSHAARVASHRGRAQRARPSPPAADGNWSTRLLFGFCASTALQGHAHTTPMQSAHAPPGGACADCFSCARARPWRAVELQNLMRVGGILCAEQRLCACL